MNKDEELQLDISKFSKEFFDDYSSDILSIIGDDVTDDVKCSSGYEDEDIWTQSDIKLSFGRVISEKLIALDSIKHFCYDLLDNYKSDENENNIAQQILSLLE